MDYYKMGNELAMHIGYLRGLLMIALSMTDSELQDETGFQSHERPLLEHLNNSLKEVSQLYYPKK